MKSIILVSMHRVGSTIADLITLDIVKAKGYAIDSISTYVSESKLSEGLLFKNYQEHMQLEGVVMEHKYCKYNICFLARIGKELNA